MNFKVRPLFMYLISKLMNAHRCTTQGDDKSIERNVPDMVDVDEVFQKCTSQSSILRTTTSRFFNTRK